MRAIFNLPAHYGSEDHPLAYIEWFRPLHTRDPLTNMYRLCCSTANCQRHAAIIRVHDIWQACHLGPRFSSGSVGPSLTTDNVLEVSDEFYFNYYINMYYSITATARFFSFMYVSAHKSGADLLPTWHPVVYHVGNVAPCQTYLGYVVMCVCYMCYRKQYLCDT